MKILSTKNLKPHQRDLLLGAGGSVVMYDAIAIEFLSFERPSEIKNAIFTSQNGVQSIVTTPTTIENCFCVGQKTKALLEKNNLKVIKTAHNSSELGNFIKNNYENETFHYFCGTERRDELPALLKTSKNQVFEIKTYKTRLKPMKFEQIWDGILFFSPSAVESFVAENTFNNSIAFCIGKTTAAEVQKHTSNSVVANSTSIESVIAKAVKTLRQYD